MLKRILFCAGLIILLSAAAWAQPAIRSGNGVLNASSYGADIARGSWFVIFGTGMGPSTLAVFSGSLPYPTDLSGSHVTFTPAGGGTAIDARLWYTSAGQLAGLLPSGTAAGDYDVRVSYNSQASAPYRVKVVERNFGFATQAQNGAGPAQATYGGADLNRFTTGTLGQFSTRPAHVGDVVVLWGTGLGADSNSDLTGAASGDMTAAAQVKVVVGGVSVTPAYAGRSNGSPGLDQINFTLPSGVASSCFVSLQVSAGGRNSNLGSIAVADAGKGSCASPSLSDEQLSKLDAGGTVVVGSLNLSKTSTKLTLPAPIGSFTQQSEGVSGSFGKYTVDAVASANFSLLQTGSCFVLQRTGTQDQIITGVPPVSLDAGAQLTLNGPGASNKAVPRGVDKTYTLNLYSSGFGGIGGSGSPTLTQGTYTIEGTGGADIGAFKASVDLPGNFTWTNQDTLPDPVPRGSGMTITWSGGGSGLVGIAGVALAQTGGTQQNPVYSGTIFSCTAPASSGTFTVPSSVMQQLPVVSSDPTGGSFGLLTVSAIPDFSQGAFKAPLTAGGSIDQGYFLYTVVSSKATGFK